MKDEDREPSMRALPFNTLIALALIGWVQPAASMQSYCATGEVSPLKLQVTVRPEQRQDFVKFLQSNKEPLAVGARYVGRSEGADSLSIFFLEVFNAKTASKIYIGAKNKKPSSVFDFSFWSCNTTRSLDPYEEGVRAKVTQFGAISVLEIDSE